MQQPGQTSDPYSMPGLTPEQRAQISAQNNLFTSTIAPADQNSPQSMFNNYLNTVYSNYNSGDLPSGRVSPVINPIGMPYEQNPRMVAPPPPVDLSYTSEMAQGALQGLPEFNSTQPPVDLSYTSEMAQGALQGLPEFNSTQPPPPTNLNPIGLPYEQNPRMVAPPSPVTPLSRVAQQAQAAQAAKQQRATQLAQQFKPAPKPVAKPVAKTAPVAKPRTVRTQPVKLVSKPAPVRR
jgi:hypothetical protein